MGPIELQDIIVDSVSAIIASIDTGIIIASTPPTDLLFGYMRGELVGKNVGDFISITSRKQYLQSVVEFQSNPQPQTININVIHRDGSEFSVVIGIVSRVINNQRSIIATIIAQNN